MTMLAFIGTTVTKSQIIEQLRAHAEDDAIVKGQYWENGKGCAVGCTLHSGYHVEYESRFGIPQMLAFFEDFIFEGLPNGEAKKWPIDFMETIQPGTDLSCVGWQFLHWLLTDEQVSPGIVHPLVKDGIKQCADALLPLTEGKKLNWEVASAVEIAAESVARSAWSAAESAARSAAESTRIAWSAAWSAAERASSAWSVASAAESAAESAASAAWSAASAARSAAWSAAESAAWSAAERASSAESEASAASAARSAVSAAESAARSAASAARSTAWSAAESARSAWNAADSAARSAAEIAAESAAYILMSKKLIALLRLARGPRSSVQ